MFKNKLSKRMTVIALIVIESISLFLMNKSALNKPIVLDEVGMHKVEKKEKQFAILLQSGNSYVRTSTFPTSGYLFDSVKSGCMDDTGEKILINGQNVLTYDNVNHVATLNAGSTSYCYLYFNIDSGEGATVVGTGSDLVTSAPSGLNTTLVEGLYRYQGTVASNYICFGTTSKSDCTSDTDAYMYRIIGVDSSGKMKLIKKETLPVLAWHSSQADVEWPSSSLNTALNGSSFLTNTTYIPDSSWSSRIADTNWHYGDVTEGNATAASMASTELGFPTTSSAYKIGLMYIHDYEYSLAGGNNCSGSGAYSTCKTSWIYLWQGGNDLGGATSRDFEWIITRMGLFSETYYAWIIYEPGNIATKSVTENSTIRPVFYLNASEEIASGTGTLSDPYILSSGSPS